MCVAVWQRGSGEKGTSQDMSDSLLPVCQGRRINKINNDQSHVKHNHTIG